MANSQAVLAVLTVAIREAELGHWGEVKEHLNRASRYVDEILGKPVVKTHKLTPTEAKDESVR